MISQEDYYDFVSNIAGMTKDELAYYKCGGKSKKVPKGSDGFFVGVARAAKEGVDQVKAVAAAKKRAAIRAQQLAEQEKVNKRVKNTPAGMVAKVGVEHHDNGYTNHFNDGSTSSFEFLDPYGNRAKYNSRGGRGYEYDTNRNSWAKQQADSARRADNSNYVKAIPDDERRKGARRK